MTQSMIERVAKAIYEKQPAMKAMYPPIPIPWDQASEVWRAPFLNFARAAIEAMREPTEGMVDAAYRVSVFGADLHDFVAHDCSGPVWEAMIEEALTEKEN